MSLLVHAFTVDFWSCELKLVINVWPMYSWHPSPLSQWWLRARAAERLNYKSHLTWKWTLLSSVPEERANFAYFCCIFLLFLRNTQISFADDKTPSPFFSVLTLSPKGSRLSWPANQSPESIPGGSAIILGCCFRWGGGSNAIKW